MVMVRDKLKKFNIKVILLVLFGFGLIFIGVGSLNIKLGVSKVNSSKKFASGDSFITELSLKWYNKSRQIKKRAVYFFNLLQYI